MVLAGFWSESSRLRKAGIYMSSPVRWISYNCGKAVHVSLAVMPVWPSWAAGRTNRRQIKQQCWFSLWFPEHWELLSVWVVSLVCIFRASLILPYQWREKQPLILESGLDCVVPSSCHCWTKNVPGGTGYRKLLNSTLHVQCGLNKNTSSGLIACAVWGSREAVEANLKSHVTSSVSLKTFS